MWYRVDLNYSCAECKKNISGYGYYDLEKVPEGVKKILTDDAAYLHHRSNHVFCWKCKRQIKCGEGAIPIFVGKEVKELCEQCGKALI